MMWGSDLGWSGWLLMSLTTLSFWVLVATLVFVLWRANTRDSGGASRPSSDDAAQRILDERLARGEIGVDEYQARQDVLRSAR